MNKELEALQELRDLVEYLTRINYVPTELRNEVKELLIKHYEDSDGHFSQIEEALKRNEPMKVLIKEGRFGHFVLSSQYDFYCPSCKRVVGVGTPIRKALIWNYCPDCGQKLDWSDENDKSE